MNRETNITNLTNSKTLAGKDLVYLKKWMKTKHAVVFRLSNKVVQVIFEDKSELALSSISKKVSYLNKKGDRQNYLLSNALDSGN